MARLLTLAVLVLAATATSAEAKRCDLGVYYETINHAKGVSCARAERVIRAHLDGTKRPFGFTCRQKPDAPSVFIVCRKGDKRFRYESE